MGFDVGTIYGDFLGCARQGGRQLSKQVLPNAFLRPAVITIVDRGGWAVVGRAILPTTARLQHVNDRADDTTIIFSPPTRRTVWQMWFDQRPLIVGKPELPLHVPELHILRSRSLNQLKVNEF